MSDAKISDDPEVTPNGSDFVPGLQAGSPLLNVRFSLAEILKLLTLAKFEIAFDPNSPNDVVSVVTLRVVDLDVTDVDMVLQPQGAGALQRIAADGSLPGGNKRGANAVDFQGGRSSADDVAAGQYSVLVGGVNNKVPQDYASILGGQCGTTRDLVGAHAHSSYGINGGYGSAQYRRVLLTAVTTDDTPKVAAVGGFSPGQFNQIVLDEDNQSYAFEALFQVATASDGGAWRISGLVRRGTGAGSVGILAQVTDVIAAPAGALSVTFDVDTTIGSLQFTCVGDAADVTTFVGLVQVNEMAVQA